MTARVSVKKPGKMLPARAPSRADRHAAVRPWHLFLAATLIVTGVGLIAVRGTSPVNLAFMALAIWSAGAAGFGLYRTVSPLLGPDAGPAPDMLGGRTRAALEREKALALRAIKELEFDRAMGKVSEADFQEMGGRLRARAVRLIQQLDDGGAGYRALIEREVAARQRAAGRGEASAKATPASQVGLGAAPGACARCGILNDSDAKYCKQCGNKLLRST